MILSDKTLLRMLEEKTLTVEPLERGQVQPASIDIAGEHLLRRRGFADGHFGAGQGNSL